MHCGGDLLNVTCAWPHLNNVDFSYNGIGQLDDSVVCTVCQIVCHVSFDTVSDKVEKLNDHMKGSFYFTSFFLCPTLMTFLNSSSSSFIHRA